MEESIHGKDSLIELKDVHKSFDSVEVLRGISVELRKNELVSILGPSGCGKSTLLNIITGITGADSGHVRIKGEIGYMQQKDLLLPWKTVLDNVVLPQQLAGRKRADVCREALPYFRDFGIEGYEHKYPYELSGGMRQRAAFLRTFLSSSEIMLLDEPFGALDSITRTRLQKWLLDVKKKLDITILFITHDVEEAILLSDRIYVISEKPSSVREELILDALGQEKGNRGVSAYFVDVKKTVLKLLEPTFEQGEGI
jgi:ABC-type nitrate/sulfonate/bicarbonate transport system ATPase subunit